MNKYLIDPTDITKFNRTNEELELFILFCVCVAGKTAKQTKLALAEFLEEGSKNSANNSPFDVINQMVKDNTLFDKIKKSSLGRHYVLYRAFKELSTTGIDLRQCSIHELEKIYGIGPKTSRFFIVHSRPAQKYAILDTHVLSYLRERGYDNIPKATPGSTKKYNEIEIIFLKEAKESGKSVAQFDLDIWNERSR